MGYMGMGVCLGIWVLRFLALMLCKGFWSKVLRRCFGICVSGLRVGRTGWSDILDTVGGRLFLVGA
jgi:hypothetical protein